MKRLAIFCDGTWNRMSAEHPTNVLIASQSVALRGPDGTPQITYYNEGVGTSFLVNEWWETRLAGAFGWGLLDKIEEAYRFLIFNYEPGDELYIFGFSRGAFTARSLAGLVRKCGIVPRSQAKTIGKIFAFYKDATITPDSDAARAFRMQYSPQTIPKESERAWRLDHGADAAEVAAALPLRITYVGVWDTVGALGVPQHLMVSNLFGTTRKYQFHDTDLSSTVGAARHAVAVDEDRMSFAPALWSNLDVLNAANGGGGKFQQLWFPGDHGSVGGGGDIVGLSHAALGWVMAGAAAEGLSLEKDKLAALEAISDPLVALHNQSKRPGFVDRIYRRKFRDGPQQRSELAPGTLVRLDRHKTQADWPPYRPETLKPLWPRP